MGLYCLLFWASDVGWVDRVPRAWFNPPVFSLTYVVGRLPPSPTFEIIDLVATLALLTMTLGWHTRASTAIVVACRLIGGSFTNSFGTVDADMVITVLLVCMLIADWGRYYSLDARVRGTDDGHGASSRSAQRGLAVFGLALAFGFLTAGLAKRGWVDGDLSTSGVLSWYYPNRFMLGREHLLAGLVPGTPAVVLEVADYLAAAMELLGLPLLLLGRRTWRAYLVAIATFHLINTLVLNISFHAQSMTYLVFVDWTVVTRWSGWRRAQTVGAVIAVAATVWHVGAILAHSSSLMVFVTDYRSLDTTITYAGVPIGVFVVVVLALEFRRCWRAGRTNVGSPTTVPF
jgi:hypothetical protein